LLFSAVLPAAWTMCAAINRSEKRSECVWRPL
jgi:hypothetical protein